VKINNTGGRYDLGPNIGFVYHRRRRNLLLGYRQVCQRPTTSKSAQVARGAHLPRRDFATSAAANGNILANARRLVETRAEGEG
jgi:hypothetical protein